MDMVVHRTKLKGVCLIDLISHSDGRGQFMETYQLERYNKAGVEWQFVQDNRVYSYGNVLRGLHYQISEPFVISSSPLVNLKISFENLSNNSFKDVLVDYRIRNSSTRQVYFLDDMVPSVVFEHFIFDGLGTTNEVAYSFNYKPGMISQIKNILITQGQVKRIPKQSDLFIFEPEIINTNKTVQEFFFMQNEEKYFSFRKN